MGRVRRNAFGVWVWVWVGGGGTTTLGFEPAGLRGKDASGAI